mmetsp:Transcript_33890/g.44700  ORF Transcript_33890/g.44700 Transcript_33890/m.44700 type:complete len:608 (+) Transcript_33890:314-2137(+)
MERLIFSLVLMRYFSGTACANDSQEAPRNLHIEPDPEDIDEEKLYKAKLFIGLYIGLHILLSWLVRRLVHGWRRCNGWKPKTQHYGNKSARLMDKQRLYWGQGSVFKDFWYYYCNNHPILSMALSDKAHPVGPWKSRFIFLFTETITIAFVYLARSIWGVTVYYRRIIFLILILGPINGITNFILNKIYSCPCIHEKAKEYDKEIKFLCLRQMVDVSGVLITIPFCVMCIMVNELTAKHIAEDVNGEHGKNTIDVDNMIMVYLAAHYSRWIGLPILDLVLRFNVKHRYTVKVLNFKVLDIGVYQDFVKMDGRSCLPSTMVENTIIFNLKLWNFKFLEIIKIDYIDGSSEPKKHNTSSNDEENGSNKAEIDAIPPVKIVTFEKQESGIKTHDSARSSEESKGSEMNLSLSNHNEEELRNKENSSKMYEEKPSRTRKVGSERELSGPFKSVDTKIILSANNRGGSSYRAPEKTLCSSSLSAKEEMEMEARSSEDSKGSEINLSMSNHQEEELRNKESSSKLYEEEPLRTTGKAGSDRELSALNKSADKKNILSANRRGRSSYRASEKSLSSTSSSAKKEEMEMQLASIKTKMKRQKVTPVPSAQEIRAI